MKLSERLLEIFDAKAAAEREQISAQAPDIDALGEIISTAHYSGIELQPDRIHPHGDSIQLTPRNPEAAIAWMQRSGFSLKSTHRTQNYRHNCLVHPALRCPVVILTPCDPEARS